MTVYSLADGESKTIPLEKGSKLLVKVLGGAPDFIKEGVVGLVTGTDAEFDSAGICTVASTDDHDIQVPITGTLSTLEGLFVNVALASDNGSADISSELWITDGALEFYVMDVTVVRHGAGEFSIAVKTFFDVPTLLSGYSYILKMVPTTAWAEDDVVTVHGGVVPFGEGRGAETYLGVRDEKDDRVTFVEVGQQVVILGDQDARSIVLTAAGPLSISVNKRFLDKADGSQKDGIFRI
jgi:hypothetical protein